MPASLTAAAELLGACPVPAVAEIDPQWLTSALEQAGIACGAYVRDLQAQSIGTGQVGENVRFTLTWSAPRADLPATVVGKFPSRSEVSRATAASGGVYVREVGFYRDLQAQVSIRTPTIRYLGEDRADNSFVMIMDDLDPAEQGDQLAGTDLAGASLAVDAAAGLHASTWGRAEELAALDWLELPGPERGAVVAERYNLLFPGFAARYHDKLSDDDVELGRRLGGSIEAMGTSYRGARCVVHNDFRLDNMLYGLADGEPRVTVVDWQTVGIGFGPTDVAYFLGAGMLPALRRAHEAGLVDRYIGDLRRQGVDADREEVWHNYRLGTPSGYIMAVVASQIVEQTSRGDEMFVVMASRHADQMRAMELRELLG